ncbi:MAG TPA: hypothetical protein VK212_10250 [Lentimicrobium sp.]|nr:hypothetical protein [Lentimicrobium sp.]
MKNCILLIILSVNILSGKSQTIDLSLQAGISTPLLDFRSSDLSRGSFALTGFAGSIKLQCPVKGNWGAFVQSGIQLNPINVSVLGYEKVKADPFLDDLYIRSDPFKTIEITGGPTYKMQILQKLSLEAKLDAGLMMASTPYQLNKPSYFIVGPAFFEITPSTDYCFTYGGGISFIYAISPCYSIGVNSQYLQAHGKFKFIQGQSIRTDERNINLWNNNLSIIVKLF